MDDVFFGAKRVHLAVNRWAARVLRAFGLTPARFDLMRLIYERGYRFSQDSLRHRLGVARSTVSRMLRALEALGFVTREVDDSDRRTRMCTLTFEGRRAAASVMSALVWPRVVAEAINTALRADPKVTDVEAERASAEWLFRRLVYAFALGRGALVLALAP
jgi:DNA-binding MarR family transcriptional regulator